MNWTSIGLIFRREIMDQLRDRRTLFTVVLLPLFLYPLLGAFMMQLSQFFRPQPVTILVVGAEHLPQHPPLFAGDGLAASPLDSAAPPSARFVFLPFTPAVVGNASDPDSVESAPESVSIARLLQRENADLAVVFSRPVRLDRAELAGQPTAMWLYFHSSRDQSRTAVSLWRTVVATWRQRILGHLLTGGAGDELPAVPVPVEVVDLARPSATRTAVWGRLLPLLIMVWCLTGAFYPAIDLCAGEKERGTLETLLSSPASRGEIALGKLAAVMVFSIATAILNLASMGLTAWLLLSGSGFAPAAGLLSGPPPAMAIVWVFLATIPASALFGGLSLAAAAFARSSKEGQYYLIPLIMCGLPLMIIPTLPAARLDLGTSLIPITGIMLVLRAMIEGNWSDAIAWFGPVTIVTVAGVAAAIRWVVYQFSREEILFRPSERFSLRGWLREFFRTRDLGPAPGHVVLCGLMIMLAKFGAGRFVQPPASWNEFALQTVILLPATVLMPALLMTIMLSRRPAATLLLGRFHPGHVVAAVILAVCLHPVLALFSQLVMRLYPHSGAVDQFAASLAAVIGSAPSLVWLLVVMALLPAVCEELAFRGFALSGFRSRARPVVAVVLTAVVFAGTHAVFQQSVIALATGLVLGLVAVRSGTVLACIAFHATHNGIALILAHWDRFDGRLGWLVESGGPGEWHVAAVPATVLSGIGLAMLVWMLRPANWSLPAPGYPPDNGLGPAGRITATIRRFWPSRQTV